MYKLLLAIDVIEISSHIAALVSQWRLQVIYEGGLLHTRWNVDRCKVVRDEQEV